MADHHCHALGCTVDCPPEHLCCVKHWRMVPRRLQAAVYAAYRPGQCQDKKVSRAWLLAARQALNAVALQEGQLTCAEAERLLQGTRRVCGEEGPSESKESGVATICVKNPKAIVREAFWLAWQACGRPSGNGWMQDRPTATREQVWANILARGDYLDSPAFSQNKPGKLYADYVYGRMMKLGLEWTDTTIRFTDARPHHDDQSWCRVYATTEALLAAAAQSLGGGEPEELT